MNTQTHHISDLLPDALQQLRDVATAMDAGRAAARPAPRTDDQPTPPHPAPTAAHLLLHRRSAA